MDKHVAQVIANWWVAFTDKTYLKQDAGDREINKVAIITRLTAPKLVEEQRQRFLDELTLAVINHDETKDLEIAVDYNPNKFLQQVLSRSDYNYAIELLLPIKTSLNYLAKSKRVLVTIGYNGETYELNI